jgi:hypothetical protein
MVVGVLFERRFWDGIADGSITVTFRRWKRPQAVAGRPYRTAAGILDVEAVELVAPEDVTDEDATRSGYPSAAAVLADLRGSPDLPITRIRFRLAHGPDPRAQLAADDALDEASAAAIARRLDRLDQASATGPWTAETLALIAMRPAVRAADLAAAVGRETAPFKLDVRKLKNLGLTISLGTGYRLSPRGEAFLKMRTARPKRPDRADSSGQNDGVSSPGS